MILKLNTKILYKFFKPYLLKIISVDNSNNCLKAFENYNF